MTNGVFNPNVFTSALGSPFATGATGAAGGFNLSSLFGPGGTLTSLFGPSGFGTALGSGIGSLLGGFGGAQAFGDIGGQIQKAIPLEQQFLSQALGGLQPFQQAGAAGARGELAGALQGLNAPGFISQIAGQFQQSPAEKFAQQQALEAGRSELESRGLGGSGAAAQELAQRASNIAGQQQQQFIGDVLSGRQQTLGALGQLGGMGLGAAETGGQLGIQTGQNISELLEALGQAQAGQQAEKTAGTTGFLSDLFQSGALPALMNLL